MSDLTMNRIIGKLDNTLIARKGSISLFYKHHPSRYVLIDATLPREKYKETVYECMKTAAVEYNKAVEREEKYIEHTKIQGGDHYVQR